MRLQDPPVMTQLDMITKSERVSLWTPSGRAVPGARVGSRESAQPKQADRVSGPAFECEIRENFPYDGGKLEAVPREAAGDCDL